MKFNTTTMACGIDSAKHRGIYSLVMYLHEISGARSLKV
jgi:hypothetical protein